MTDLTRVLAYKTKQKAGEAIIYWKGLGYHIAIAGPTDAIQFHNGEDAAITWESGTEADWYILIATKAQLEIATTTAPTAGGTS